MTRSLVVLLTAVLSACNSGPTKYEQQVTQASVTPKGSIVGRVTELGTSTPLGGVKVTLNAPTQVTATTDDQGLYAFSDVVVTSTLRLVFEKDGYLRNVTFTAVPGSVGNNVSSTPLAGGVATADVLLAKADGVVKGIVFLPNSKPAVNATVVVDQRRSNPSSTGGSGIGESVVTTKTGMDGSFTLSGLGSAASGVTHRIIAQWFDENGDMQADYGATTTTVDVYGTEPARVFMQYTDIGQKVIDSNVFDGEIAAADAINFTFALPVLTSGQSQSIVDQFTLTNISTSVQIAVDQTWENPTKVAVKPVGGSLTEGDRYRVVINLKQTNGNGFTASLTFQVRAGTVAAPTTQVAGLTVTNPARTPSSAFDYNDTTFTLAFNTVPGITGYMIYAKDTTNNQSYVFLQRKTVNTSTGRYSYDQIMPSQFNNSRPLSAGNKVTFAVVPIDGYGNTASLSAAPAVTVSDNVAPRVTSSVADPVLAGTPDGINDTAAESKVLLRLFYTEPMDVASPPVYTNSTGAVTQSFVWEAGTSSGILTLTIPAGGDITGPFSIRGGKDIAGNVLSNRDITGTLGGVKELMLNGSFEDTTGCSITSWAATGTPAPVSALNNSSNNLGKCGAVIGSPIGAVPVTGLTKVAQDVVLPAITNGLGWGYEYRFDYRTEYATTGDEPLAVTQRCRITDTSDVTVVPLFATSKSNMSTFQSLSGGGLTPATTVRFQCEVNNATTNAANAALFIDNVSIALVKPGTL